MSGPGSWRRRPLPPDWEARIRPAVLRRDGGICQWKLPWGICAEPASQVDHIDPDAGDGMGNLRALCEPHHKIKSGREGGRASGALRSAIAAKRWRPQESHPGLIRPR